MPPSNRASGEILALMRVDVLALQQFYSGPMGQAAQAMAGRRMIDAWGDCHGLDVLGFGYTTPYMAPWQSVARRTTVLMPATQGVERWPGEGPNQSCIGDEDRLPFKEAMFDRILCVHAFEEAENPRTLMRELWRVLAPEGRLMICVANRSGLWARAENTPFGQGRPFSRGQLSSLLTDSMFQPVAWSRALYAPPLSWKAATGGATDTWESVGEKAWPAMGGLLLVDAVKRLYADSLPGGGRKVLLAQPAIARFEGNMQQNRLKNERPRDTDT
jgi:SAM-dependent methyltransferase